MADYNGYLNTATAKLRRAVPEAVPAGIDKRLRGFVG